MYARALSVYESLITTTHDKTILSACYNPRLAYREGRQRSTNALLKDSMTVLQKAIYQLLSLLERKTVLSRVGPNSLKEYLILTLTLFVNTIMLQPTSSPISKFLQLNKGL